MASRLPGADSVSVQACAKINLTLRVTGLRSDGYHGLRTIFQSVAMHDTLAFVRTRGAFQIECDDPACPTDRTNLVWRAAAMVWRGAGRRGDPVGVTVRIVKRIPLQSGLGGGSSDAAAAIRGLGCLWGTALPDRATRAIAAQIGADVPFFFEGGTALGLDRGDLLFPLVDLPAQWVTLVVPSFGVSTKEAFGWLDGDDVAPPPGTRSSSGMPRVSPRRPAEPGWKTGCYGHLPPAEYRNDLERSVAARHPDIARIVRGLRRRGAEYAAMSGSGSVVFGIFASRRLAALAARTLATGGRRAVVTRMVGRAEYAALSAPK